MLDIKQPEKLVDEEIKPMKIWLATIMVLGGLGALIAGADLIVPSAVRIAVNNVSSDRGRVTACRPKFAAERACPP